MINYLILHQLRNLVDTVGHVVKSTTDAEDTKGEATDSQASGDLILSALLQVCGVFGA